MAGPISARTRKTNTDNKMLQATIELLRDSGVHAVTIDAVAARSGVAKTTIYRRYTDRIAMLQAAVDHYLPWPEDIDTRDPKRGIEDFVQAVAFTVESYIGFSLIVILNADDDPATIMVRDRVLRPRAEQLATKLTEWRTSGALREDLDIQMTIAIIFGALWTSYGRDRHFAPDWAGRFITYIWPLLEPERAATTAAIEDV